jgi:hypothetical protein
MAFTKLYRSDKDEYVLCVNKMKQDCLVSFGIRIINFRAQGMQYINIKQDPHGHAAEVVCSPSLRMSESRHEVRDPAYSLFLLSQSY